MKIGLLPLYIKLYDDTAPQVRGRLENFYSEIAKAFEDREISVVKSDFCRLKNECAKGEFYEIYLFGNLCCGRISAPLFPFWVSALSACIFTIMMESLICTRFHLKASLTGWISPRHCMK